MTRNLALYQILLMLEQAEVTEIRWDGQTLETEPPDRVEHLHRDLLLTIRGRADTPTSRGRPASRPFTLHIPGKVR